MSALALASREELHRIPEPELLLPALHSERGRAAPEQPASVASYAQAMSSRPGYTIQPSISIIEGSY